MIDVEEMKLIDILPSSLDDENIKLIIKAVDALVEDVSNDVKKKNYIPDQMSCQQKYSIYQHGNSMLIFLSTI